MTEKEVTSHVVELATRYGYRLQFHPWRSDNSAAGFPDWIFLKPGRLVGLELKGDRARTDARRRVAQARWLGCLATVPGCGAGLIVGSDGLQFAADLFAGAATTTRGA